MSKTLNEMFKVGQHIKVEICKPDRGNFPIGKIVGSKITCLFERSKLYFEIGSIWEVQIVDIKKNVLIIHPVELVKSKHDLESEFKNKLNEFKEKGLAYGNIKFK